MIFEPYKAYKYVRLSTDEIRFTEFSAVCLEHKDLVKEGEKAYSAGLISVWPDCIKMQMTGSMSLRIQTISSDYPMLEKIIGKPFRGRL